MPAPTRPLAWSSADILRVAVLIALVYLTLWLLWVAQDIVFITFIGILFGLTLSGAVDKAARRRIPRGIAAPVMLLSVIGLLVALGFSAAPQITSQLREVQEQVPKVVGQVRGWIDAKVGGVTQMLSDSTSKTRADSSAAATKQRTEDSDPARDSTRVSDSAGAQAAPAPKQFAPQVGSVGRAFFTVFSSTVAALGGLILVFFLTLFIAIDPTLYQRGLEHLVPHQHRPRMREVLSRLAVILRRWLVTQLIAMVVIGVVTGAALWALGIRGAIALGVIAGILEFIPFLGPIAAAVPAIAMGLLDSPEKALWVVIVFTVIQQAEGHLLIPLLMKDSLDLPPVLTILSQALMTTVFGFLGLLVAVPLLAAVMVVVKMLYVQDVVGDKVQVGG